ncbi:hypothetical protein VULLAG_LOCUS8519 [Vulpes lagopus]
MEQGTWALRPRAPQLSRRSPTAPPRPSHLPSSPPPSLQPPLPPQDPPSRSQHNPGAGGGVAPQERKIWVSSCSQQSGVGSERTEGCLPGATPTPAQTQGTMGPAHTPQFSGP